MSRWWSGTRRFVWVTAKHSPHVVFFALLTASVAALALEGVGIYLHRSSRALAEIRAKSWIQLKVSHRRRTAKGCRGLP